MRFTSSDETTEIGFEREAFWQTAGNGLSCNGTSTQGVAADDSAFDLTSGGTICVWVNPSASTENGHVITKHNYSGTGGWGLFWEGSDAGAGTFDTIRFYVGSSTSYASSAVFTESSAWVHCAITWDASGNIKFYKNGVAAGTAFKGSAITDNSLDVVLGNRSGGTTAATYFSGGIDQACVFNRELSATELLKIYNSGKGLAYQSTTAPFNNGLVACWELQSDGTDSSGNNHTLTMTDASYASGISPTSGSAATGIFWVKSSLATTGTSIYMYFGKSDATDASVASAPWDANYKAVWHGATLLDSTGNTTLTAFNDFAAGTGGKVRGAFTLDGTDYATAADGGATDINGANQSITISAWVYADNAPAPTVYRRIICKDSGPSDRQYYLSWMNDGASYPNCFSFRVDPNGTTGTNHAEGTSDLVATTWQYVGGVYNDVDQRVYFNGSLDSNGSQNPFTYSAGIYNGAAAFTVGANPSGTWGWVGKISEVRISNTARSAAWVKFEYANMSEADNELTFNTAESEPAVGGFMTTMRGIW